VSPFTLAVGAMTLALFSLLAAVYLTIEAEGDAELQDDFRRRALGAAAAAMVAALVALALGVARGGVMVRFLSVGWTRPILAGSALAAVGTVVALLRRHFKLARVAAAGWVTLILWGWVLAQFPLIIPPSLTIDAAAAPRKTLRDTIVVLAFGSAILVPSLWYLLRVFKTGPASGARSKS
jgi:cytochrome d ubiquinol oxidase subunit II